MLLLVQQRYQYRSSGPRVLFTSSDWDLYVSESNLPAFVDQMLWLPRVLDVDRVSFEVQTGYNISDTLCLNPPNCTMIQFPHYRPQAHVYFPNYSATIDLTMIDALFAFPAQGVDAQTIPNAIQQNKR